MPKPYFPIGTVVDTNFGKGLIVEYNPPSQSKMNRDRYHVYLYDINVFDYPPSSETFVIINNPNDQTKTEVQTKILDLISQPNINQFKIGDVILEDCDLHSIILDNGWKTPDGNIQYHIGTYQIGTDKYFLSYIFEQEISQQNVQQATTESKHQAYRIIKQHMLEPIF